MPRIPKPSDLDSRIFNDPPSALGDASLSARLTVPQRMTVRSFSSRRKQQLLPTTRVDALQDAATEPSSSKDKDAAASAHTTVLLQVEPPSVAYSLDTTAAAQPLNDEAWHDSAARGALRIAVTVVVLIVFSMLHLELSRGVWRPGRAMSNRSALPRSQ